MFVLVNIGIIKSWISMKKKLNPITLFFIKNKRIYNIKSTLSSKIDVILSLADKNGTVFLQTTILSSCFKIILIILVRGLKSTIPLAVSECHDIEN